jgi:hypothetical protein
MLHPIADVKEKRKRPALRPRGLKPACANGSPLTSGTTFHQAIS